MHSTGMGTTPVERTGSVVYLRSPLVQVKNLDDMLATTSSWLARWE